MKTVSTILLALLSCFVAAQTNVAAKTTEVSIVSDPDRQKINIEVNAGSEIGNLLVLIVSDSGTTVFMEDRAHYKGVYKQEVDMKKAARGEYDLKIIADKEEINKKVVMR